MKTICIDGNSQPGRSDHDALRRAVRVLSVAVVAVMAVLSNAGPLSADSDFEAWREAFWPDAQQGGVTRATFDSAFKGLKPDRSLPDLEIPGEVAPKKRAQAEFVKPPSRYLSTKSLASLTRQAGRVASKWSAELDRIEKELGVQREIVLAIWGRETVFGAYKPKHDALTAIATQAYLGRRKDYFRMELVRALMILQEGHVSRDRMRASWAGAMGLTQFMPSNFYRHAVDFDGDGHKDIWSSVPDALASTAKSLVNEGWTPMTTWGYEVRKPKSFDCTLEGPEDKRTIREWTALGFTRTFGRAFSDDRMDEEAYLLLPEGTLGPAFLMLNNFAVIKTYNFSDLYALFVGNLADRIGGGGEFETRWATSSQLRSDLVKELQDRLNKQGINAGPVDGFIGTATRSAIGAFQKAANLEQDCYPSREVLAALRKTSLAAN